MPPASQHNRQRTQEENTLSYIVRKSEKLTTALYMISDILSDKEPLKWTMREGAVEILSDMTIAATSGRSEQMTALRNALKKIEKVASFLDIAGSAKMISEMNAGILKKEYLSLKDAVEGAWTTVHADSKQVFSDNFFDVPRLESTASPKTPLENLHRKGVSGDPKESSDTPRHSVGAERAIADHRNQNENKNTEANVQMEHSQPKEIHTTNRPIHPMRTPTGQPRPPIYEPARPQANVGHHNPFVRANTPNSPQGQGKTHRPFAAAFSGAGTSENSESPTVSNSPKVAFENPTVSPKTPFGTDHLKGVFGAGNNQRSFNIGTGGNDDRRKIILALVKQKPALTVGDVARSIPNVSEKTIQRELLSMVSEGILQKRGERRWSTYSLR